jgi:hypothetical protein
MLHTMVQSMLSPWKFLILFSISFTLNIICFVHEICQMSTNATFFLICTLKPTIEFGTK